MSAMLLDRERCPFLEQVAGPEAALRHSLRSSPAPWGQAGAAAQHAAMLQAYQRTGGLDSSDEVTLLLRRRTSQPISLLARWIVAQRVVSFGWESQTLLPMFQFDLADMSVRCSASAVLDELSGTFDDGELAAWFALPNAWLRSAAPVDLLEVDQAAVLDAARADRYIARG